MAVNLYDNNASNVGVFGPIIEPADEEGGIKNLSLTNPLLNTNLLGLQTGSSSLETTGPAPGEVVGIDTLPTPDPDAPVVVDDAPEEPSPDVDVTAGVPDDGEIRFNVFDLADFTSSLRNSNPGDMELNIRDYFSLDPDSSKDNPLYRYNGNPIGFYGGYGKDINGNSVKLTSGRAVVQDGARKGQAITKHDVIASFNHELGIMDMSGGGGGDFGGQEGEGSGAHGGGHGHGAPDTSGTESPSG